MLIVGDDVSEVFGLGVNLHAKDNVTISFTLVTPGEVSKAAASQLAVNKNLLSRLHNTHTHTDQPQH